VAFNAVDIKDAIVVAPLMNLLVDSINDQRPP
jgi:hypothetical protein